MSGLLLDTHVWVWYLQGSPRLPLRLRRAITGATDPPWLSSISIWEAGMLVRAGRLEVVPSLREWIDDAKRELPVQEAPLSHEIALVAGEIGLPHGDPADRFIAATAIVYDVPLMTLDRRLTGFQGVRTFRVSRA